MEQAMPHQINDQNLKECTRKCNDCSEICYRTATHCLQLGGEHASADHQVVLQDCADICATAARFMSRGSHHHSHVCRECAEICAECADGCDRIANGDALMKQCAQICRECAQTCDRMAAAVV